MLRRKTEVYLRQEKVLKGSRLQEVTTFWQVRKVLQRRPQICLKSPAVLEITLQSRTDS